MNVKGIGSPNVVNLYSKNLAKKVQKSTEVTNKDRIELSELGKKLSSYDINKVEVNNKERIDALRKSIENGTYNVDAKLTAESIMKAIKEGR